MFDLGLEGFYCSPILDGKLFHFKPFLFQTKMLFLTLPFTDSSTASLLNVGILQDYSLGPLVSKLYSW